jgi:hypothetical protein
MYRTVLYRRSCFDAPSAVSVNDEIGLQPYLSYTAAQHLEDLSAAGKPLVGILEEREELVDEALLDPLTILLVQYYDRGLCFPETRMDLALTPAESRGA